MCRLLPPHLELDITKNHISSRIQIVDRGTSPLCLVDAGVQVVIVFLDGSSIGAASDAMFDAVRVITEKGLDTEKAVRHDHPESFVVVVMRMGQH